MTYNCRPIPTWQKTDLRERRRKEEYGLKGCEDTNKTRQGNFLCFRVGNFHVSLSLGLKLQDPFIPRTSTVFPHHYFKIEAVVVLNLTFNLWSRDGPPVLNISTALLKHFSAAVRVVPKMSFEMN